MKLPTFDEAAGRVENGVGTALDKFIYDQEPAGEAHEREFREGLAAVLAHQAADAERLRKLLEFCTEAKTNFGPRGDLRAITMKFKNSVETSSRYRNELRKLIDEIQPSDKTKVAK